MSIQFSWSGNLTKTEYIESILKLRKYLKYLFLVFVISIFCIPSFYHPTLGSVVTPDEQSDMMTRNMVLIMLVPASLYTLLRISLLVRRLNNLGKNGTMYGVVQIITISVLLFLSLKYFYVILDDNTLIVFTLIVIGIVSYFQSHLEKLCEQGATVDTITMQNSEGIQMTDQEKEAENTAIEKLDQYNRRNRLIGAILLFIMVEGFIGLLGLIAGATSGKWHLSITVLLLTPIILFALYLKRFIGNKSIKNS